MPPVVEAVDLVPFCELPVELVPVAVPEGRKETALKTVPDIIDVFESRVHEVLCRKGAPCSVTGEDEEVVRLLEHPRYFLYKGLVFGIEPVNVGVVFFYKLPGRAHVGKKIRTDGMPDKLVLRPGPHVNEIGIGNRVQHVIGLDTQDALGFLCQKGPGRDRQETQGDDQARKE